MTDGNNITVRRKYTDGEWKQTKWLMAAHQLDGATGCMAQDRRIRRNGLARTVARKRQFTPASPISRTIFACEGGSGVSAVQLERFARSSSYLGRVWSEQDRKFCSACGRDRSLPVTSQRHAGNARFCATQLSDHPYEHAPEQHPQSSCVQKGANIRYSHRPHNPRALPTGRRIVFFSAAFCL